MRSRIIVAALGIPVVYVATWAPWLGALAFALLVMVATVLAASELCALARTKHPFVPAVLIPVVLASVLSWRFAEPGLVLAVVLTVPLILVFQGLSVEREDPLGAILATLACVAYIAIPAGSMVVLRSSPHGFGLILILLAGVWLTDTGAYVVGKLVGTHKLAPRISPGKTIEGFLGGLAAGVFTVWFSHYLTADDKSSFWLSGTDAVFIGVAISLAATVGDLFESLLKRSAGVKDSGSLLGEHGGVLDRIDALLLAAPIMYIAAFLVGVL